MSDDNVLEKEYYEIRKKLEEAEKFLKEANELATKNGTTLYDLYYEDYVDIGGVFSELDEGGWSTSSIGC